MQQSETETRRGDNVASPDVAWGRHFGSSCLFMRPPGKSALSLPKAVLQARLPKLCWFRSGCRLERDVAALLRKCLVTQILAERSLAATCCPLCLLRATHWAPHSASSQLALYIYFSKRKRIDHEYQQVLLQLFEHNSALRLASAASDSNFMN